MEALRIFQRQTLQQLTHTRPFRTHLSTRAQISHPTKRVHNLPKFQARPLYTRFRPAPSQSRALAKSWRQAFRNFATATETSTQNVGLSQRLKNLSREYGWTALGVYLLLSALDFPFCFLAVRWLGTDRIGHWEHVIVSTIKEWIKWPLSGQAQDKIDDTVEEVKQMAKDKMPAARANDGDARRILETDSAYISVDHGYKEASQANKGEDASIWTQLALAYAIHKSFIFIRVPLTAAVLPKVVKTLRSWGWKIGNRPVKEVAGKASARTAGVNMKGSGVTKE